MSYIDEKEKLIHRKKEVLEKYKTFFSEVMMLSQDMIVYKMRQLI